MQVSASRQGINKTFYKVQLILKQIFHCNFEKTMLKGIYNVLNINTCLMHINAYKLYLSNGEKE